MYEWLLDLRQAVDAHDDEEVQLVGVALTERANDLDGLWGAPPRERAFSYADPIERDRFVRIVVLRTLARLLRGGEKVGVFVSHAKADGAAHAEALMATLRSLKAEGFLDIEQIEGGQDFAKVLKDGLAPHTVMVAVVSDEYSRRVWCRWEALRAKQQGLPTVVLDIVTRVSSAASRTWATRRSYGATCRPMPPSAPSMPSRRRLVLRTSGHSRPVPPN